MSGGALVEGLRWLFWGLVYLVTMVGAVFVFARAGLLMWVALLAVAFVIGEDVQRKRRGGGGVVSVLGIGGALALVLGMGDRPRPSRRVFVPGEVVEVGCRSYRVVSVAADGEPTLERVDP